MDKILIIVDPQNDFCCPDGSLYVNGAEKDCSVIARMINEIEFKDIFVTLDMHSAYSIYHDIFWLRNDEDFHGITKIDSANFITEFAPKDKYDYRITYEMISRRKHTIDVWPVHCVVGEHGSNIAIPIANALYNYSYTHNRVIHYLFKGTNPWIDEYSAFSDRWHDGNVSEFRVCLNSNPIDKEIYVCGEAASHCVKHSISDLLGIVESIKEHKNYIKLVSNATSYVTGFESVKSEYYDKINSPYFEMIEVDV